MARMLNIAATTLNEVLSGKKNLSIESACNIANKLNLTNNETDFFILLVQLNSTKTESLQKYLKLKIKNERKKWVAVKKLDAVSTKGVINWKNAVIMALSGNPHYQLNAEQISKTLNTSLEESTSLLTGLVALNLLTKSADGHHHIPTHKNIKIESKSANLALQNYHKDMLKKTIVAIEKHPPKDRIISSETFSFSSVNLKLAEDVINECFGKLVLLSNETEDKNVDSVYYTGIQLFKLSEVIL